MFGPSQVMAVTGHKSVQSLSVYQRVSDDEKMMMGDSLTRNILPSMPALPDLNKPAILPRPASLACAVRHQNKTLQEIQNVDLELTNINMNELFNDFEGQEITCSQSISVNKTSLQPASVRTPRMPPPPIISTFSSSSSNTNCILFIIFSVCASR